MLDWPVVVSMRPSQSVFKSLSVISLVLFIVFPLAHSVLAASRESVPGKYKNWLQQDVAYIITNEEKKSFLDLSTDADRSDSSNTSGRSATPLLVRPIIHTAPSTIAGLNTQTSILARLHTLPVGRLTWVGSTSRLVSHHSGRSSWVSRRLRRWRSGFTRTQTPRFRLFFM